MRAMRVIMRWHGEPSVIAKPKDEARSFIKFRATEDDEEAAEQMRFAVEFALERQAAPAAFERLGGAEIAILSALEPGARTIQRP